MCSHEPEAVDVLTYNLDHLELQQVEPDFIEGWGIWPGAWLTVMPGTNPCRQGPAIASGLKGDQFFRLVDQTTERPAVLTKAIQPVKTPLGEYQLMDFSEVRQTGSYVLEAGAVRTRPFQIDTNVRRHDPESGELSLWRAVRNGGARSAWHMPS